jgi:hypothetical protein
MVDRVGESARRGSGGYINHEACIRSRIRGAGIEDYEVPIGGLSLAVRTVFRQGIDLR